VHAVSYSQVNDSVYGHVQVGVKLLIPIDPAINPGVKVNGTYYCELHLDLATLTQNSIISGEFFIFQQISPLSQETPAMMSPDLYWCTGSLNSPDPNPVDNKIQEKCSSMWSMTGMALYKVSLTIQQTSGTNFSARVKEALFRHLIWIQNAHA